MLGAGARYDTSHCPYCVLHLRVQKGKAKEWILTAKEQTVISTDTSCYLKLSHNLIAPCSSGTSIGPSAHETYCLLIVAKKKIKLGRAAQLVWQPACHLGFAYIIENLLLFPAFSHVGLNAALRPVLRILPT